MIYLHSLDLLLKSYSKNFTIPYFLILISNRANFAVRGPSSLNLINRILCFSVPKIMIKGSTVRYEIWYVCIIKTNSLCSAGFILQNYIKHERVCFLGKLVEKRNSNVNVLVDSVWRYFKASVLVCLLEILSCGSLLHLKCSYLCCYFCLTAV